MYTTYQRAYKLSPLLQEGYFMKKKIWIPIVIIIFLAILFVPIPKSPSRDGGTKEYTALTYKIVDWNRYVGDTIYDKTKTYLLESGEVYEYESGFELSALCSENERFYTYCLSKRI